MKEDKHERFFCKDKTGKDLFYLELFFDYELETIFWTLSFDINLFLTEEVKELIHQIVNIDTPTEKRLVLIDILFEKLKSQPEIENHFISEFLLDKNAAYNQDTANTLTDILMNKEFPDYTPFSKRLNTFYFYFLIPILKNTITENETIIVEKKEFELFVKNRFDLQAEYVEEYSKISQFICVKLYENDSQYKCYVMTTNKTIKLFFIEKVS